jgi:YegS/Rv2252/BmrU family lipid kinase
MRSQDAWLAIVNPASGRERARAVWPSVERELDRAGVRIEVELTTRPHEGEAMACAAARAGRRRILVAGGDGSVHDVVNGIMNSGLDADDRVTLAVAPGGTGNDWARSLGIGCDPLAIVASIVGGRTSLLDVGVIDFPRSNPPTRRWFVNVAGAGYDAHVISRLPERIPSALSYFRGALSGLASYRSALFHVAADGVTIDSRLLLALVANGRYCGNHMDVAPNARPDDGVLDVVLIDDVSLASALMKIAKLYRGTILRDPVVRYLRTGSVRIDSVPPVAVEADGQVVGETPAEFSLRPRALHVVTGNTFPAPAPA